MADERELPMFPLGSVLFPAMPLALRVFEDRYLAMLQDVLPREKPEFGVVLIERGQEVGGGEHRFDVATVAEVAQLKTADGYLGLVAQGGPRVEVVEWLADDPYPRALVRDIDEVEWVDELAPRREQTESLVRRTLARASEFADVWSPTVELDADPVAALWQLAAIAPIGPLDQVGLLRATDAKALLDAIFVATTDAGELLDLQS